ncbi:MAG: lysophospholipid acyltransferase family protein [Candidatus Dormibacteraceae bacterium]
MRHAFSDLRQLRRGWRWGEERLPSWPLRHSIASPPSEDLSWARTESMRSLRWLVQRGLSLPFTKAIADPQVVGSEWLNHLQAPVILVSNHVSHADTQLLLYALPDHVREHTVVAAAADYWYSHPWLGRVVSVWLNTFPFARSGSPKAVLASSRRLLMAGWNLLIYPEGGRSSDGRMQEFKPGIGWLAVENRTAVIPMHVCGSHRIMPKGQWIPLPAPVTVRIGKPLWPVAGEGVRVFTSRIEAAVRNLAEDTPNVPIKGSWIERWQATAPRVSSRL